MVAFKGVPVGPLGVASASLPPAQQQQGGRPGEAAGRAGASSSGNALTLQDVDVDLSEVYFLIMHFLSGGPCQKAFTVLWNELLQHKLLPRRFHALYSKLGGSVDQDENDDGLSYPLNYAALVQRNPHIEGDHLIKLLKQLLLTNLRSVAGLEQSPSRVEVAALVPTLVGRGAFSLLDSERSKPIVKAPRWMTQFLWPARSLKVNQVNGLTLRQISGGFSGSHRSPSQSSSNYLLLDPPTLVSKITAQKKILGHRNAVYCAIFDRRGQLVITGSDDRLVKIWSATSGLCLRGCRGHEGDITDLAVSICNTMVASASNDCTIRVWRLDGWPLCVLRGHQKPVTQIQFSPQQNTRHHLLSSSDDGTCRIWNVVNSSFWLYVPRPEKDTGPKAASTPPQTAPGINQFVCCAFNGDGSLFVTGSSDKYARVWQAPTLDAPCTEHPLHELDRLEGHANEVNYVQFSGCAAIAKTLTASSFKEVREEQPPSSKWFSSAIVTCSRDGSAIIWTPRRRRQVHKDSQTKKKDKTKDVKYWKKTFHLKVPNPPLPPQPSRGGGARQRVPTPRGVNMIVWSLDNRFVLAIMDCRICVWNSVDGTLVHCLTGHTKATYVLDVHPFDPRIAMSAGYDGRVIIWDIHKGVPITQFETGDYELVDGNFSPDGTSLVVSDEVGQMHLFAIGDEEKTWKDAKYDQFFLGDYRPLVRDTYGNVLDQETQMPPAQRNLQDLLCDASMIPYPEPYQSLYQQLRLGAIGMEWEPPVVMLAVGMTDDGSIVGEGFAGQTFLNMTTPERRASRAAGPPVFIDDVVDWEPEPVASSEDGSDYSASEDRESQDDGESLRSLDNEEEGGDTEDEVQLRRSSRRNKRKAEDTLGTTSRRKLRRKSRHQVVDYPYERHYERRAGQGRHSRSNGGASKQELAPRSKRKAAKRAERMFKRIPNDDDEDDDGDKDDDDGDNEDEDEDEDENQDELAVDQMSAFELGTEETSGAPRRGIPKHEDVQGVLSGEFVPSTSKQGDESDSHDEGTEQDSALRQSMSGFGEFCRVTRPRSQRPRKMLIKFKNKFAGSDQEVKVAHEGQLGPYNDLFTADHQAMAATSLPESSSSKPLKKLVVKYPKPSDEPKEPFIPNAGSPNETDLNEGARALIDSDLCDMDEPYVSSAQDDKRKWEWKKGKAAKRVRLGVSPGDTDGVSIVDELAVSGDDSPEWTHGLSHSSQPHLSLDTDEGRGHGGGVRYVSQSPSNSSGPTGMPSSGGLGLTTVPTNVRRRSRNLLLAESEDESHDARLLDVHYRGETAKCDDAGGSRSPGVNGLDNGRHLVEFRSSAVSRASPMPLPEPGSSDSDGAKHSKFSNGVKGLRVRMKASSVEGNPGILSDSGDHTQAVRGHTSEDSGASDIGHMNRDDRRSPPGSDSDSPTSPRRVDVNEESSAEDEDVQNQEDENDDGHEDQDDEHDEEGGRDGNDGEYKCAVSFRVNGTRVWTTTENPTGSEDDGQSDDLHSPHGDRNLPNGSYSAEDTEKAGLGRKAASNRRQIEITGATVSNGDSGNMMQTRRMTQMMAGKSVSDQVTRSGNLFTGTERRTRSRGDQSQRLTVAHRTQPQRQRKHVDTDPRVHNSDRLYEDRTRVGRRTSARTRPHDAGQNVSLLNGKGHLRDLGHIPEPHVRGGRNQKMRKREAGWLLATKELGMRYVPQIKDAVVYFRQGHEQFLKSPESFWEGSKFERPWQALAGSVRAVEFCRVEELEYKLHPKSRESYCQLVLMFIDQVSEVFGYTFKVNLPILKNCPEFIVEKTRYDAAMQRAWSTRDHCQVLWANEENGEWWMGRIKAIKPKSSEFPDSPWEKYQVQYKSVGQGGDVVNHSPWELYDCDQPFCVLRPQLDEEIRSQLLVAINKLGWGSEEEDEFGLQELENLIGQPQFVNKTPLPISMKTVKARLEDEYYHGLEQFNHDLDTIVDNLVMYYGEDGDMPRKLRNLRRKLTKSVNKFSHRS